MPDLRLLDVGSVRMGRRGFLAGLALVGAGALVACSSGSASQSSSSSSSSGSAAQASNTATVKMTDQNKFDPDTVTISTGGTVTWQNAGTTPHSATFDPSKVANKADVALPSGVEPFDSGLLQGSQTWSHTFTVAGTYKYTCIPHEALGMHGTIIVK